MSLTLKMQANAGAVEAFTFGVRSFAFRVLEQVAFFEGTSCVEMF